MAASLLAPAVSVLVADPWLVWAEPHARFTLLFERFAIEVLRHTTIQAGRMILRISWDEAWHVMKRAVQRGLRRKPERMIAQLGVDEKSVGSGQDYVTVVCDLERSTVEEVTEGNNCRSLQIYFEGLTDKQREGIEAVAMDMAGGYINAVSGSLPEGREKIVFDRFHIMKLMNEAVDRVRREEHKRLTDGGSSILTGTKFLWLYARERLPAKHWEQFSILKAAGLKTAHAVTFDCHARCGAEGHWSDQAGYFVSRAAVAAGTGVEHSRIGGPAWQAAMSARMAYTSMLIDKPDESLSSHGESRWQYQALTEYLNT